MNDRHFIKEKFAAIFNADSMRFNKGKFVKAGIIVLILLISFVLFISGRYKAEDFIFESGQGADGFVLEQSSVQSALPDAAPSAEAAESAGISQSLQSVSEAYAYVHIDGAVQNPGVYKLTGDIRVFDAVDAAGGLSPDADSTYINMAQKLSDGDKVFIPKKESAAKAASSSVKPSNAASNGEAQPAGIITEQAGTGFEPPQAAASSGGLVNINTAGPEELQTLNGVGPATAEKIISYREQNGSFKSIDDITNVSGIGEKTLAKFRDKICI